LWRRAHILGSWLNEKGANLALPLQKFPQTTNGMLHKTYNFETLSFRLLGMMNMSVL
jgi:hypothetical protein